MQNPSQVNDILNYLNLQEQQNPSAERMEEITALLAYSRELQAKETRRRKGNRTWFALTGLGLLLGSAITLISGSAAGPVIGFGSLLLAVFYTLGSLSGNPLTRLQEKMDQMHARLVKPVTKVRRRGTFRAKQDRIIAGVAAELAERMGVSPLVIRLLFLGSILATGGGSIVLYILAAVVLSFFPPQQNRGISSGDY